MTCHCDAGLCSVEVDCFAVGKDCLVGHNQADLQAHQTLQAGILVLLLTCTACPLCAGC